MARPHPALFELAAGRRFPEVPAGQIDHLLASAFEHRMAGLLWTRVLNDEIRLPQRATTILAKHDLHIRSRNLRLWRTLKTVQERLSPVGVAVTVAKGIATERRWYDRLGERQCNDLDLFLDPSALHRITDVVRALQPQHHLLHEVQRLMATGMLQSIDLAVEGVEVDLHTDLLKFEVPTRQQERMWRSTRFITGPDGVVARVLAAEFSLVHLLLHLNKDNFSRLGSYADVARILSCEGLDWPLIDDFLRVEGLQVHVYGALEEVVSTLALPRPPVRAPSGPRAALWRRLWPKERRLGGLAGLLSQRHRLLWISWSARGRLPEAVSWWLRRRVFPPEVLVDLYYPKVKGPYLWRLASGRWLATVEHRQHAARLITRGTDSTLRTDARYKTFPPKWAHLRVPTASKGAALAGLALYSPCQPKGYLARDAAWATVRLLGPRALPGRGKPFYPPVPAGTWDELLRRWAVDIGRFDGLAAYARPQQARTGFAVLLLRGEETISFVRVDEQGSAERFATEQRALELCSAANVTAFWHPEPLAAGSCEGLAYFAMTALPAQRHTAATPPLTELLVQLDDALRGMPKDEDVPAHWRPMHGDLTPWNCRKLIDGETALVDWEDAGWGPPGVDDVLFRATSAALHNGHAGTGPAEAIAYCIERVAARAQAQANQQEVARTLQALHRMVA